MNNLPKIQMLKERVFVIDLFLETYNTRIAELSKEREKWMQEITELRVTPIVEA
jgi:prefoldin subunit 5